jgi:hypothetical protein
MFTLLNADRPLPTKIHAHHERDQPDKRPLRYPPCCTERECDYTGHGIIPNLSISSEHQNSARYKAGSLPVIYDRISFARHVRNRQPAIRSSPMW